MNGEQLVRERLDVISTGSYDKFGDILSDDVVTHYGSFELVLGAKGQIALLEGLPGFTELQFTVEDLVAQDDRVAARLTIRGAFTGEFAGLSANGARVEFGGTVIHRVRDGRLQEVWEVDDLGLRRQLATPRWSTLDPAYSSGTVARGDGDSEASRRAALRWIELLNAGRFDELAEAAAADLVLHHAPDQAPVAGLDNVAAIFAMYHGAFPDMHIEVLDSVADGDTVMLRNFNTGTHRGELYGIAPSGRAVRYAEVSTYRVRGGKIVEKWAGADVATAIQTITAEASNGN